ncbi:hypothetical protein [Nesterenkonia rhizosphaerae]|uniref:DUF3027 domain-containing protein n=1 Tax=Nesterenkonia rhizosphaerae TaxID=1348272 RepID=A0ABP9FZC8_9MICC
MTVNLAELSAAERMELLQQLQDEERRAQAERRAQESLNRALRRRLVEVGVEHHAPWVRPVSAACAYPLGWVVTHAGQKWLAVVTGASDEPSEESPQWGPYDSHVEGDDSFDRTEDDEAGEAIVGPVDDPEDPVEAEADDADEGEPEPPADDDGEA